MGILGELERIYQGCNVPFLVGAGRSMRFSDIAAAAPVDLDGVGPGDSVALIGDFDPASINTLLRLIDLKVVLVPLTIDTRPMHEYFFDAAGVSVVIEGDRLRRLKPPSPEHPMLAELLNRGHAGLVLFSSGTTGRPKAILHDFEKFLVRYRTPRPALRTLNFLLFDHIGGINTLLHTLYNRGVVVIPSGRTPEAVLSDVESYEVEALPTTPTFLRMMLFSEILQDRVPATLKVISYGTERMDQSTLETMAKLLPDVDFRQTYGMSELGILRVKSRSRDSLWMKIGGEGIETRVVDNILYIRSEHRMIGYLNAPSSFDEEGWYNTNDLTEQDGSFIRIVGRRGDLINVGGVKVLPSEIEHQALLHPEVLYAYARGAANPITGQHIELLCEPTVGSKLDTKTIRAFLKEHLPESLLPHRIKIESVPYNHRFKRK